MEKTRRSDFKFMRTGLHKSFLSTISAKLVVQVLGFLVSLYVIKLMGEAERGRYVLALSFVQLTVQFLNFGLHTSNTYYSSKEEHLYSGLQSNTIIITFLSLIVSILFFSFLKFLGILDFSNLDLGLISFSIPLSLMTLLQGGLLVGRKEYSKLNYLELGTKILGALGFFFLVIYNVHDHEWFLAMNLVISGVWIFFSLLGKNSISLPIKKFDMDLFKKSFKLGFVSYVGCVVAYLIFKIDLFLITYYLGEASLGTYSVAVSIIDAVLIIPAVFGQILFSEWTVTKNASERFNSYLKYLHFNFILLLLAAFAISLVIPHFFKYFFNNSFAGAAEYTIILSFAAVFIGTNMISMNFLGTKGMPIDIIIIPSVGLIINVISNIYLIPRLGIVGACYSSFIAYVSMFLGGLICSLSRENASDYLHRFENVYGYRNKLNWITKFLENDSVILDVGCGTSFNVTASLLKRGYKILGIDTDPKSIDLGKNYLLQHGLSSEAIACKNIDEISNKFDVVICAEVLEHLNDDLFIALVNKFRDKLKDNGVLLVTVPNGFGSFEIESWLWNKLKLSKLFQVLKISDLFYYVRVLFFGRNFIEEIPSSLDSSPHVQNFTYKSIKERLVKQGFELLEIKGGPFLSGPLSNHLTGFSMFTNLNNFYGSILPSLASGFYIALKKN